MVKICHHVLSHFLTLLPVPEPPSRVAVMDRIVVWQAPNISNGMLLGYNIRVFPPGSVAQAQLVNKNADDFYHVFMPLDLPRGADMQVHVQVIQVPS